MRRISQLLAVVIGMAFGLACAQSWGADSLDWKTKQNEVDANIANEPLIPLLKKIARATGWKVYVEPGASTTVSVKFKDVSGDDALRRLLGKLNYTKDETNGITRLLVFRTERGAATQAVQAEKKDYRIHDQDLVKLKRGASTNAIDQLAKKVGAKIIARNDQIGLYKLQFPDGASADSALQDLASDPSVAAADGNYSFDRPTPAAMTQVPNPAGSLFSLNPQPNANGPVIGLVDTSVDPPDQFKPYMLTPINVTGETDVPTDDPTHGTGMLETMLQAMANDPSKILPVDVFGSGDSTSDYEVMEGIVAAINGGANPINLSLGDTGESTMLGSLIQEGIQKGIVFVAAAGNTPGEGEVYPADYPGVISVTASSQVVNGPITSSPEVTGGQQQLASYANDPSGTDIMAPGTSYVQWDGQTWVVEGTSPATASTTGTIADLVNQDHMTLSQAVNQVMKVAPALEDSWVMHADRQFFLLAVIIYGLSTIYSLFLWRKGFRTHDRINYALLLVGFAFHFKAMLMRGLTFNRCPVNNLYEAMVFVDWTIVAVYLALGIFPRLRYLGAFASPVIFAIGVFALMPSLDMPYDSKPQFGNGLVSLHAALTLLSYGAFGLSSIAAVMYLTQEHDLKFHKLRAVISLMPPIDRLEKITSRLLWSGFVLLTAGLAIIPFLLKQRPELRLASDPKLVWSALVWSGYLALLLMHSRFSQSGRKFAWGAVGTFAFVLLTFWGVNLLSPAHRF